jgi:hypothetical protein
MPNPDKRSRLCRTIGFAICAVVFGIPGLLFVGALTYGVILVPVLAALILAPPALAHYLLWGARAARHSADGPPGR